MVVNLTRYMLPMLQVKYKYVVNNTRGLQNYCKNPCGFAQKTPVKITRTLLNHGP